MAVPFDGGVIAFGQTAMEANVLVDRTTYERDGKLAAIRAVLRPGDVMVDVGAHIGLHSLTAARRVGVSGRVISVEPQPPATFRWPPSRRSTTCSRRSRPSACSRSCRGQRGRRTRRRHRRASPHRRRSRRGVGRGRGDRAPRGTFPDDDLDRRGLHQPPRHLAGVCRRGVERALSQTAAGARRSRRHATTHSAPAAAKIASTQRLCPRCRNAVPRLPCVRTDRPDNPAPTKNGYRSAS